MKRAPGRYGAQLGFEDPRRGETVLREIVDEMLDRFSGEVADRVEMGGAAELPDGFPAATHLRRAGIETMPQVRRLAEAGDLRSIRGVGSARGERIRAALEEMEEPREEFA